MTNLPRIFALLAIAAVQAAMADDSPPPNAADLIAARRAGMEVQATRIAAILKTVGTDADVTQFAADAAAMAAWGQDIPALFPPGTEGGPDTKASAAVWSDRPGFENAAARLTTAAESMAKAAAAGDQPAFIKAFRATSLACAACHVTYRFGKN
jgi:cytochrome c556